MNEIKASETDNLNKINESINSAIRNPLSIEEYQALNNNETPDHGIIICRNADELSHCLQQLQKVIQFDQALIQSTVDQYIDNCKKSESLKLKYGRGISFNQAVQLIDTPQGLGFSSVFTTSFERNSQSEAPLKKKFELAQDMAPAKAEYDKLDNNERVQANGRIQLKTIEELKMALLIAKDKGQSNSLEGILRAVSTVREFHDAARIVYEKFGENVSYGAYLQLVKHNSELECLAGWDVRLLDEVPQPPDEKSNLTIDRAKAQKMIEQIMRSRISVEVFSTLTIGEKNQIEASVQVESQADLLLLLEELAKFPEYNYLQNENEWRRLMETFEHEKEHYTDAKKISYAIGKEKSIKLGFGLKLFSQGFFVPHMWIRYDQEVSVKLKQAIDKMIQFAPTTVSDLDIQQFENN